MFIMFHDKTTEPATAEGITCIDIKICDVTVTYFSLFT